MGLVDDLAGMTPDRGNRVDQALKALEEKEGSRERKAWMAALDSGAHKLTTLAALLSRYSGHSVSGKQVSDWNRKRTGK